VKQQKLDTAYTIETPEGVTLELYPSGPVARGGAWLVDMLIRTAIYLALAMILGAMGATGMGIMLVLFFLLEWFYPTLYEAGRRGATPGKRLLGLRVVRESGAPITFGQSLLRNMMRAADMDSYAAMTMAGSRIEDLPADQFNHCVTALKKADGTGWEMYDPTWVPYSHDIWSKLEAEQHYLIGSPEGEYLDAIPYSPPAESRLGVTHDARLLDDGTLVSTRTETLRGLSPETIQAMHLKQESGTMMGKQVLVV